MLRISPCRLAQVAIGLLLVIVIRWLSDVLRLYGPAVIGPGAHLYLVGSLAAAVATLVAHTLHAFGRDRLVLLVAAITIFGLLVYKITQPL
jgi:hypothetical protein